MKVYGYLRVSSDEQDINSQKQGVESFAAEKGLMIDEYITAIAEELLKNQK